MTNYATVQDLQLRYDWREIGDLVSDSDEQISALDQATSGNQYNTLLVQLLSDASGDIEAALLYAGRYATTDLSGLTGNSLSLLKRITCEITIAYLRERKPFWKTEQLEAYSKAKEKHLERLRTGANVFNLPLVIESGAPEAEGPTTADYRTNFNLICDRARGFPARRLPYGR